MEEGAELFVVVFSTAAESLPAGAPSTLLGDEFRSAMHVMGVPSENQFVYDYQVRHLPAHRQQVLEELVRLRGKVKPDTVFLPSGDDIHQDHQVVHIEGLRAFRESSVFGYELPRNHIAFSTIAFTRLEQRHIDVKWAALECYDSQFLLERPYFSRSFVESLARVRGTQVGADWAEAFQVYRYVI